MNMQGQIRALVTGAGNPVLSVPNGRRTDAALASLEFMVAVDFYLNESTRHAHVILPPTSPLEHDHYDMALSAFAVRNVARYSAAVFAKPEGTLHDWEIFLELGRRMAALQGASPPPALTPVQVLDMGLAAGPYGALQGHALALSTAVLQQHPHGLDLGPNAPCLPQRLAHADKRIVMAPAPVLADLARLAAVLAAPPRETDDLLLIGRRHVRSNNSWMHNYTRLVKGPTRHELWMHPDDMAARDIADGALVRVRSRVGEVEVPAVATPDVMRGVVSLPHGFGHNRDGVRMQVATAHAGVSVNDITDEAFIDRLSGNAAVNGVPVRVLPAGVRA